MGKFKVKTVSSLEKVFPSREPSGVGFANTISALTGETVSFQIAYYWGDGGRQNGTVHVNAPEQLKVQVRKVGLVPCVYPCHLERDEYYLSTEPGLYPDVLQELGTYGFPIVSGQWRSLWVDVEVPEALEAGTYTVELELRSLEWKNSLEKLTINIEVICANVPQNPIYHTEWFHCDCLANYYGVEVFSEKHWEIIENFVQTAVKRGCNMLLTPIFTPPLDTEVGGERRTVQLVDVVAEDNVEKLQHISAEATEEREAEVNAKNEKGVLVKTHTKSGKRKYSFRYDKFERWVAMCERCGVTYFEMSHLFTQWGAAHAPKIVAVVDGTEQKIFGWETEASGAEYTEFLRSFLQSFTAELEKLGIAERCFFHVSDEPGLEQLESYKAAKDMLSEYLDNGFRKYRIIDALSDYEFYKRGLVDEPVCASNHLKPFLEARPKHLWVYYCTAQGQNVSNRFIVMQGSRTRILGLQLYKFQLDGFLQWGYNFYNSQFSRYPINPYMCTDADGAFPSGDPFLVYPGADGTPEESLRIMLMQEAFQDLAALKCLENLAGREAVLACLCEEEYGELGMEQYPREIAYVIEVRERVNREIQKYNQKNEKTS